LVTGDYTTTLPCTLDATHNAHMTINATTHKQEACN